MKTDVKKLLGKCACTGIKPGDLVITAEVHRVIAKADFGRARYIVVTVSRDCNVCKKAGRKECIHEHIMGAGIGQQGIMKLKGKR